MYAAAGGASLASRQARQKQRKQNTERIQQINKAKLGEQKQRQFQNYTDSKIKIPRVPERSLLKPHALGDHRRHSTAHLKEVTARARLKESPSVLIPLPSHHHHASHHHPRPLSPTFRDLTLLPAQPPLLPHVLVPEGDDTLERRCSFVRQVEELAEEEVEGAAAVAERCNHAYNYEGRPSYGDIGHYYSEFHRSAFGSLDYPFSETMALSMGPAVCSQGRAAWQERQGGRRCSLSDEAHQHRLRQSEAHRRWMKKNRIHDSSYPGESDENIFAAYQQSAAANALLYAGLGTTAIGSVVFFVGSGDKGFKTLELRLIGPTLVACGLLCCLIRVLLCACPSTCFRRGKTKTRLKSTCSHGSRSWPSEKRRERNAPTTTADFVQVEATSVGERPKKRVSIAQPQPGPSLLADADCFPPPPQYDRHPPAHPPQINVLEFADFEAREEAGLHSKASSSIELRNLEMAFDVQSVSSGDEDDAILLGGGALVAPSTSGVIVPASVSKLTRTRVPVHGSGDAAARSANVAEDDDDETCLSVVVEGRGLGGAERGVKPASAHSGILLSPLQLGRYEK